ncbi:hypothetical protein V6Z12_A08G046500 [Gossypium hirsutum]
MCVEFFISSSEKSPCYIQLQVLWAKHVMVTSFLLVCGAMTMKWICDTISESGF